MLQFFFTWKCSQKKPYNSIKIDNSDCNMSESMIYCHGIRGCMPADKF